MDTNQLVVSNGSHSVAHYHKQATDVAGVCKSIVLETAQQIGGRKYVRVEGWQAIATAHGTVASARDVEKIDGGWRAIGEVRRMDTGQVIATAEGFLGEDEPVWAKRPEYAKRAMAQTRAISRACRSAFAHVVVLIGSGLETTPAEEVPHGGFDDAPRPAAPVRYQAPSKPAPRMVDEDVIDVVPERIRNIAEDVVKLNTPDAKLRKKQPVAAMDEGADWQTARFIKGNRQDKTSKAGKPFTKWGAFLEIDGAEKAVWANTINRDLGETIDALEQGETVLVQTKATDFGLDVVGIRTADVPTKHEEKAAEKDIEWGTKEDDSDSIPF
jgi:hypothetical protein